MSFYLMDFNIILIIIMIYERVYNNILLLWGDVIIMFKDYEKYLSTSLKVYLFVLFIIFILKIVGLDYFGIDINNPTVLKISDYIVKHHAQNIYYSFTLYFYTYMIVSIVNRDNSIRAKIYILVVTFFSFFIELFSSLNIFLSY